MEKKEGVFLQVLAYSWVAWFVVPFVLLFVVVVARFDAVRVVAGDERFWAAFWISLSSAFVVIVLTAFFSVPVAYFLAFTKSKFRNILEAVLIDIPQTFPPVAVGVIYLFVFGVHSPINLAFTFAAVVIAKLLVSAPFTLGFLLRKFREIRASKLDLVARSLGAGTYDLLFCVFLPLARRVLIAGLTMSWARAMGEFGGSLIFAGVIAYHTEILPTYTNRVVGNDPFLALAATAVLTLFAILSIVLVRSLFDKKEVD